MNIVLAGMPGSGKTTVSRELEKLGKKVYDTDEQIVKNHGVIADIFATFGEQYFRDLETETVKNLSELDGVVIATGGGCLLRAENIKYLKQNGKIIYLKTHPEVLIKRVDGNSDRPLLNGGTRERIYKLYGERKEIYENSADVVIDTDETSAEDIAKRILNILEKI